MTIDGLIQYVEDCRARLNDDLRLCTRELRDARGSAAATGPPGPTRHMKGQVQGLWERVDVRQNQINALAKEKTHARKQCDQMAAAQTNAQKDIGQLCAHNEQLQKENECLRQELLAARATPRPAGPPSVSSESRTHSGLSDQKRIRQLTATVDRIRGEREALRKDNTKLKVANEKWRMEASREKLRNDTTIYNLWGRLQEVEGKLKQFQGQSSSHLPSHSEMGGHRPCLPAAESITSRSTTTGEPQRPSVLPTPAGQPAHSGATNSPQASQHAPQRSASATPQGPLDQEEDMESDSQAESWSERQ